jgi:HEAT repeat protein
MNKQIPDELEFSSERYPLYPVPPLLAPGHPRWEYCLFARTLNTADFRGYRARWSIRDGYLYLIGFGGATEDELGLLLDGERLQIGMVDVHETDAPVPATWISCDLRCPSGKAAGTTWQDGIPEEFLLFRIVRGALVAHLSVSNHSRVPNERFVGGVDLLDQFVADGGAFSPQVVLSPLQGLPEALSKSSERIERRQLAGLLWSAGRADLGVLIPALASTEDADVQRWIAYALGRIGSAAAGAVPDLMRVLRSTDDPEVVRAVVYALAGIGPDAASVLATAIPLVEARCGRRAERQLGLFVENLKSAGPSVIGPLIDALLAAPASVISYRIAGALGDMDFAAVMPLRTALRASGDDRRGRALARALGSIGPEAAVALDILLDRLRQSRDDETRSVMARAVADIGLRSPASLPALRAVFRASDSERVLGWITEAAATLGNDAVGFLVEEFEAAGTGGRTVIAKVLGKFGMAAGSAVAVLAKAAKHSTDRELLDAVAQALAKLEAPLDVRFAAQLSALRHAPHGYWAIDGLLDMQRALDSGMKPSDQEVRNLVAALVGTGESPSGRQIARMLGSIGKAAVEPLLTALDTVQDQRTRTVIFYALGQVGEPAEAAIDGLVLALSATEDNRLLLQMVDALVRMGQPDERHMATLAEVLLRSSSVPIWRGLGLVLAGYGASAIVVLVRILDRSTEDGQRRAIGSALLEAAASDAAAGAVLLSVMREATRPWTIDALQSAIATRPQSRPS